jgi:hypothetical protein
VTPQQLRLLADDSGHTTASQRVTLLESQGLLTRASHPGHKLAALIGLSPLVRDWLSKDRQFREADPLVAPLQRATTEEREAIFHGLTPSLGSSATKPGSCASRLTAF